MKLTLLPPLTPIDYLPRRRQNVQFEIRFSRFVATSSITQFLPRHSSLLSQRHPLQNENVGAAPDLVAVGVISRQYYVSSASHTSHKLI